MRSLSARLILGAILGAFLVTGLCGGTLYGLIERDLTGQFDAALVARARGLGAMVEYDEDGYQFEAEDAGLPRHFLIRRPDGRLLAASDQMRAIDLPDLPATDEGVIPLALPGGDPGRAALLRLTPRADRDAGNTPAPVLVVVAEPSQPLRDELSRMGWLIVIAAAAAMAMSVLVIRLVVPGGLRPLTRIATQIGQLRADALEPIDASGAPRELLPVIQQLNALLGRMQETLRREKEFAAGAAHELRTPLAGIRAKLELALSRDRQPDEHRKLEQSALEISVSMQAIVQNLLLLARPESPDTPRPREQLDLHNLLRDQWQNFAAAAAAKDATIDWDLRARGLIHADRQALQIVLSNLLENAAEYVNAGGNIHVHTANEAGLVILRVRNSGCRLNPGQAGRVFEPFWRGDESRTERAHAGLGLAICRRMTTSMGGDLEAAVAEGWFTACLRLPAA